jgi:hypothetical protein
VPAFETLKSGAQALYVAGDPLILTGFASTPWRSLRDFPRFIMKEHTSKREV